MSRAAILILAVGAVPAGAQVIANGSFEVPVLNPGEARLFATGSSIGAWTVLGTAGNAAAVYSVHSAYGEPGNGVNAFPAQDGLNSLDLTGMANQGTASGVQQSFVTVAGQQYQVSFFVGRASGGSLYSTDATVDLSIDGGPRMPFTNSNSAAGTAVWQQFATTFVATGPSTTLAFFNGQTTNNFSGLDNVVVTPIPEPGALGLAAVAVLAGRWRRGRRGIGSPR